MGNKNETTIIANNKDEFWQIIRGICIICVVLIHCKNGLVYEKTSFASWNFDYWIIMRQFINFPVAIFIFLAGYFVNIQRVEKSIRLYILMRGKRLLIPFLIWSSFYTLLHVIATDKNVNVFNTIIKLLLGLSSVQLYFILVLLQLAVLTPFLIKTIQKNRGTKFLFLLTPLYLMSSYFYAAIYKVEFSYYATFFPAWFIFYYTGLWIKIKGYKHIFKKNQLSNSILCCSAGLILSIIEGYGLLVFGFPETFSASQIKISSVIYALTLINLLLVIKPYIKKTECKWLEYLGDNSYGIFYIHMFWIIIIKIVLSFIPLIGEMLPIYQLIQVVFVIVLSSFSIFITKKIVGEKLSSQFLGF